MDLNELLKRLAREGCTPSVYYRGGGIWRAHINRCGNYWKDGQSPRDAMLNAVRAWKAVGKPKDRVEIAIDLA